MIKFLKNKGELFLLDKGEVIPVTESDKLFAELDKVKGLNTRERMSFRRVIYDKIFKK